MTATSFDDTLLSKIVTASWNEYARPERIITLGRCAVTLHLVTGLIFAASSFATQLGEAG